ncbi:hypothetical protein [Megalodesulfovibrio gigas]|uniref:Uncharacterized protein n=1 Tax=Megalodesulfovibrio gigas (strain ATCC 19364 / DSM 1382 / NCIMB 9332 / VKM B-1759) TaxID=1121448 RepID=T2GCA7_MEGG1|nr:hypothetical protein [Megalodesulfovibrio gigas]AGW13814.1 hypothetical protein DGI_2045 [Megalodesulfovibrio gigas DSM 1382 = ATCC 19364]
MRIKTKILVQDFPIPNDPDGGVLTLHHLPPDEREGLGVSSSWQFSKGDSKVVVEPHAGDARYALAIKSIKGWKGVYGEDGNELPCTDKNKALFARHAVVAGDDGDMSVLAFISGCHREMDEARKVAREDARKN